MKTILVIGLILTILGALMLAYQGFTYITQEKVVDVGPLEVTTEREKFVYLPPILGATALAVGIVLIVVGARRGEAV